MKFFISHSSKDYEYGNELVKLLREIEVPKKDIVFTSKEGHGVPGGHNIFDWLKQKLREEMFVIYLLSDNYYESIVCLNEMGASWVLENKHRAIIIPGFDINSSNFSNGAIDPRRKVIFMDKEDSIIEFLESIIKQQRKEVGLNDIKDTVKEFLNSIEKIKQNKADSVNLTQKETAKEKTMIRNITNNELSDEELLLLNYIIDMGTDTLGTGWMEEQEVVDIVKWENENFLNNYLSHNYKKAINKFKRRDFITVDEVTEYGNTRQYILKKDISKSLLNLPKKVKNRLDDVNKKYNDLPF